MDDPKVMYAVQAASHRRQLLEFKVGKLNGNTLTGTERRTSFSLQALGSFLRYCFRSSPSRYS